jgi:hypothetical protein
MFFLASGGRESHRSKGSKRRRNLGLEISSSAIHDQEK